MSEGEHPRLPRLPCLPERKLAALRALKVSVLRLAFTS